MRRSGGIVSYLRSVGERSRGTEADAASICGASGSEDAGISSESKVEILTVESPRFPGQGLSSQGQSGPKGKV